MPKDGVSYFLDSLLHLITDYKEVILSIRVLDRSAYLGTPKTYGATFHISLIRQEMCSLNYV